MIYFQTKKFSQWALVTPFSVLGLTPDPMLYMRAIGWTELVLGTCLFIGTARMRRFASLVLMFVMILTIQVCLCNGDSDIVVNPSVFLVTLAWIYHTLGSSIAPTKQSKEEESSINFDKVD